MLDQLALENDKEKRKTKEIKRNRMIERNREREQITSYYERALESHFVVILFVMVLFVPKRLVEKCFLKDLFLVSFKKDMKTFCTVHEVCPFLW